MHEHEAQGDSPTKNTTGAAGQFKALVDLIRNDGFAMSFQSVKQYREALLLSLSSGAAATQGVTPPEGSRMQKHQDVSGVAQLGVTVKRR